MFEKQTALAQIGRPLSETEIGKVAGGFDIDPGEMTKCRKGKTSGGITVTYMMVDDGE